MKDERDRWSHLDEGKGLRGIPSHVYLDAPQRVEVDDNHCHVRLTRSLESTSEEYRLAKFLYSERENSRGLRRKARGFAVVAGACNHRYQRCSASRSI